MGLCLGCGRKSEIRTKVVHKNKVEDKDFFSRTWNSRNFQFFFYIGCYKHNIT